MTKFIFPILIVMTIIACDSPKKSGKNAEEAINDDNYITKYDVNGRLESFYQVNELKQKHGTAKFFREDGSLRKSFEYENDEKIKATQHYDNGQPLMEINYKNDEKDGPFRRFYDNGQLESEIIYRNNYAGAGIKEYSKSGKLRTHYPNLIVKGIDQLQANGRYIIEVYFDDQPARGTYYSGSLTDGKFMNYKLKELDEVDYKGRLVLRPAIGIMIMEKLTFVGEYKTTTGNKYIVEKTFNLAIDNTY